MAEPRIFLSSTFYDLRQVRADLDWFIRDIGYVSIRNEGGDIPYGKEDELEQYCYREIERCDILVAIIGGRYGHTSKVQKEGAEKEYSISQMELKTALRLQKQVYIFIEKSVRAEYETYMAYPDAERSKFRPYHANNIKIHQFIAEVFSLPKNNSIFEFESSQEIVDKCRRQWAGLFQSLLERQARRPEEDLVAQLKETLSVTRQLVDYLTAERKQGSDPVANILFTYHPAFGHIQRLLDISFRVLFTDVQELGAILKERGFHPVPEIEWQSKDKMEWTKVTAGKRQFLKVSKALIGPDGKLKLASQQEWQPNFITLEMPK